MTDINNNNNNNNRDENDGNDSDSSEEFGFDAVDFTGVNFDTDHETAKPIIMRDEIVDKNQFILDAEKHLLFGSIELEENRGNMENSDATTSIQELIKLLSKGDYCKLLTGAFAKEFFDGIHVKPGRTATTVAQMIRQRVLEICQTTDVCVKVECIAIAAFNLFLQLNYTGPTLEQMAKEHLTTEDTPPNPLVGIDPHACFRDVLKADSENDDKTRDSALLTATAPRRNMTYHNSVLSELAVDGEWPSPICQVPYLLLLARSILLTLSNPMRSDWTCSIGSERAPQQQQPPQQQTLVVPESFVIATVPLTAVHVWSARAVVAHQRLLPSLRGDPSVTLWDETNTTFSTALALFCDHVVVPTKTSSSDNDNNDYNNNNNFEERMRAATVVLEWGLAQHHFSRVTESKRAFQRAMEFSSVHVELTGAEGKRTKFQQEATAQMLVRAASKAKPTTKTIITEEEQEKIKGQLVEHSEEEILLERIKYTNDEENEIQHLSILDQAILLALCLDVKNNNPADGLTGEEMGAYLARVLDHHDDWMVYSTGLLERSWLEFERSHGRERAILQIQALSDQHTNRLTITQSTFQSVEESAPVQDRLRNLHIIVYPPRWSMLADLAERYANMGIVTSAAEIFADVEMWDEVAVCYTRAGKSSKAEQVVRERLAVMETPRMWAALGDITHDPEHYEKALELSKGRFSAAHVALGKHYFDQGDLEKAGGYFQDAVKIRPLLPQVWFRLGTISMQLKDWPRALSAFTEVVLQEPEESEAWANVAAVHMHNKNPIEAYPALNESLKNNRNNWRVWISKLYVSIDLKKYDEAIQACNTLLDFKAKSNYAEKVPDLEEKCIRAIVGATLKTFRDSSDDAVALDSTRRTLTRLHELLDRMSSSTKAEPWVWDIFAVFNEAVGRDEQVLENLMKEYRSLQSYKGWETDQFQVRKVIQVVAHISHFHVTDGTKDSLIKCRFLVRGVINKIKPAYIDSSKIPVELEKIETILAEVEKTLESMK